MKIISKYKDYYDYLIGVYGVEPKLVLDRRKGYRLNEDNPTYFTLAICDKLIDVFYDGEKCYCGEGLYKVGKEIDYRLFNRFSLGMDTEKRILIKYKTKNYLGGFDDHEVRLNPVIRETDINIREGCPIIRLDANNTVDRAMVYPHLGDCNIGSIYTAEEMFTMLSNWLSQRITEEENIVDNRSDVDKLQDKGFNKVCSFRPKMKNCE